MVDTARQLRLFDKSKLASLRSEPHSLTPDRLRQRLSPTEISNLVAYLKSLSGPEPNRIASVPDAGGIAYEPYATPAPNRKAG